jgi:DNA helicase-2/ATP-dependent DNA helicase PcrA
MADVNAPAKAKAAWAQWAETHRQLQAPELKNKVSEQIELVVEAVYGDYMKSKFANYSSRNEDLGQLKGFARQFNSLEDFLAQLTLMTNVETTDAAPKQDMGDGQAVRLTSVHQAKGLEWKCVFVIMLCDGLFPNNRASENLEGEEEERRLFYVAVTRARDELYLTYPVIRATAGATDYFQRPSRFVDELPKELVNRWVIKRPNPWDD